jgi:putative tryptophan/tyrosine transport system substrate-binding protein
MRRRTCLFAGGTWLAAQASRAQSAPRVHRIGILTVGPTAASAGPQPQGSTAASFLRGMRELGYRYGEHFVTEVRGSDDKTERFPVLAAELARLDVDVIVGAGPSLRALQQATSTIPVVMASSNDPQGEGLVRSLARPGGNFTGLSSQSGETTGLRLELLKDLVPGAAPVAVLWHREHLQIWQAAQAAALNRGWKLVSIEIREPGQIEAAFTKAVDGRAGSMLVHAPAVLQAHSQRVAALAIRHRLPTVFHQRRYAEAGGLMAYGADTVEIWRHAATFVDKILKGAKPGDLPVEQPTKFELVINQKTADALGLVIPKPVLLRADQVIP